MLMNTTRLVPNLEKQRRDPLTKHDVLTVLISRLKLKEHKFYPTERSKPNIVEQKYFKRIPGISLLCSFLHTLRS